MIIFLRFALVMFTAFSSAESAFAYITPGQFLQGDEEETGGSSSSISSSSASAPASPGSDALIPLRPSLPSSTIQGHTPHPAGTPGDVHDDPRAEVFQSNNIARPRMLSDENLPESDNRAVRIPDRPLVEEEETPLPTPVPHAVRRAPPIETMESVHRAAPLAPTGLPLAIPAIFSFTFTFGALLYTRVRSLHSR